jgi:hypothetical protein
LDYVYVCRPGDNEELRYSIRSTVANLPPGKIWVVGGKPDWYTGNFIDVPQVGYGHNNVWNLLRAICFSDKISKDFVLMNDDFFTIKKVEDVEYFHCGKIVETLANYSDSGQNNYGYQRLLDRTYRYLSVRGVKNPLDYELHIPMKMNKEKLSLVINDKTLHRSTYGNTYGVGGTQTYDVKVYAKDKLKGKFFDLVEKDLTYISTHEISFDFVYETILKDMFPDPSKYENP